MRRVIDWIVLTAVVLFFGLLTAVAIGVLAWIPTAWPSYAREDRSEQLVLLATLMVCLAAACIGIVFKIIRPANVPEARTSPAVVWMAFAASAMFGLIASVHSGKWEIAAGVGVAMLSALAKVGISRWRRRGREAA